MATHQSTKKQLNDTATTPTRAVREKHGATKFRGPATREYLAWRNMKNRCYCKSYRKSRNYRDRGIKVCEKWLRSFSAFLGDMGPCPSPRHSLDRYPDKDGNYEPGNCRWATWEEQNRNRKGNVNISFDGRTQCLTDWAAELEVHPNTLTGRIARLGIEKALTAPKQSRNMIVFGGRSMCQTHWAKFLGMSPSAFKKRLARWGVAKALTTPLMNKR